MRNALACQVRHLGSALIATLAAVTLLAAAGPRASAQTFSQNVPPGSGNLHSGASQQDQTPGTGSVAGKKPMPSPPAMANVTLAGQTLTVKYNAPSARGRKIMGSLVPYGQVWRTGANPATTLITPVSLHIGTVLVPAGTYTLYTLPGAEKWMLIVNTQTGQWGTEYHQDKDLGRVEMKSHKLATPQEVMSIGFDDIKRDSAELHIRWESTDQSVKITTP